jgi:hypothetical protein
MLDLSQAPLPSLTQQHKRQFHAVLQLLALFLFMEQPLVLQPLLAIRQQSELLQHLLHSHLAQQLFIQRLLSPRRLRQQWA